MVVELSDEQIASLGPHARAQIRAVRDNERPPEPKAESKSEKPPAGGKEPPQPDKLRPIRGTPGVNRESARGAADTTRRIWRASGGGRPAQGTFTIRGFVWLFVWIGVLLYLVGNPSTLPRLVHIVFAPVNGLLAVARGPKVNTTKTA